MRVFIRAVSFASLFPLGAVWYYHQQHISSIPATGEMGSMRANWDSLNQPTNFHVIALSNWEATTLSRFGENENEQGTTSSVIGAGNGDGVREATNTTNTVIGNPAPSVSYEIRVNVPVDPPGSARQRSGKQKNPRNPEIKKTAKSLPMPSQQAPASQLSGDVVWCKSAKTKYLVVPGKSWGSLKGVPRVEWAKRGCDTVVATGRAFSCDEQWGQRYLQEWKNHEEHICGQGGSREPTTTITCRSHPATASKACLFENVVIDFSKAPVSGNIRNFANGFLRGFCAHNQSYSSSKIPLPPGVSLSSMPLPKCDIVEETPSIFMSHDLIFNLGAH